MNAESSFPIYPDASGMPLQNGRIYFGVAGSNPVTAPITVYWDAAGTQPAAQPIKVVNGMPSRNGAPARVWVNSDYSRLVQDAKGRQVLFEPLVQSLNFSGDSGSSLVGFLAAGAGAASRTIQDKLRESVSVKDFGAKGDGLADDTQAIQFAIDYALYVAGGARVLIPAGRYKTTDTIHVGYGVSFAGSPYTGAVIEGAGSAQDVRGTLIVPTFRDRPVFAISGARGSRIRGLSILGDVTYMQAKGLLYPAGQIGNYGANPGVADADNPASWVNPAWPASASSRNAPFCAIAVDPYAGGAPATPYPPVAYPAFLGPQVQYGKAASSDTLFEDLFIQGFTVGIVHSPSGSSAQDDFSRVRRCWVQFCVYGLSIGHTDARLMSIEDSYFPNCHTAVAGNVHGQQLGQCGAAMVNVGFDRCVNWFSFGEIANERGGTVTFLNCYGENAWRIGDWGVTSGATLGMDTLILHNCHAVFADDSLLGRPASVIAMNSNAGLVIEGGHYQNVDSPFAIKGDASNIRIADPTFSTLTTTGLSPYEMYARTGAPVTFSACSSGKPDFSARWTGYDAQTSAVKQRRCRLYGARTSKNDPGPLWASMLLPGSSRSTGLDSQKGARNPLPGQSFAKSALAGLALAGLDLTITFNARTETQFMMSGPLPGDVVVDNETGAVFFVYRRIGNVVTARLQNNWRPNGGGYSYAVPMNMTTASGTPLLLLNTRLYAPGNYTKGTLTAASNVITAAGSDDPGAVSLATDIVVGGAVYVDSIEDAVTGIGASDPFITAVDNAGKTITLTGNALKSETARPLGLFVLPPVANI